MSDVEDTKKYERNAFLFITVVLFPAISLALMGSYGFVIWMSQIILRPPGA
ncbi:periplasmic nitrate reductase, NapE protein [Catenovulum sp. SM1970]|uniref:periplasmic nitrate reductase, NapE protein n=1 Tax=Marinifaba aquimaris TaxID=2741323 RepID=UPI001574A67F|nr:periplasmic nitrate reductase, NapE protein [Marinifaba aquimaris]NTS78090.1 periplasmic nitrate reductase, NapE protein [Marinifaba aquimaris]